jgi:hypothetical protein
MQMQSRLVGMFGKEVHPDEAKLASVQLKSTGQSERLIQADLKREKQQQSAKKVKAGSTSVKESEDEVAKKPVYAAMKLKSTGNADAIKAGGDAGKEVHPDEGKLASVQLKSTGQSERLIQAELEREKQQQSAKKVKPVSTCVKESEDEVAKKPVYAAMKLRSTGNADAIKAGGDVGKEVHPDEGKLASVQLKSTGQSERLIQAELEREKQQQSAKKVKPVSTCVKESEDEVAGQSLYAGFRLRSTGNADAIRAGGDVGKQVQPVEGKLTPSEPTPSTGSTPPESVKLSSPKDKPKAATTSIGEISLAMLGSSSRLLAMLIRSSPVTMIASLPKQRMSRKLLAQKNRTSQHLPASN